LTRAAGTTSAAVPLLSLYHAGAKATLSGFHNIENSNEDVLMDILKKLWREEEAQDIAEYAVMLAVIMVLVVGTIRLIGSNSNNVFSSVSSSLQ
jgi:Flp pilus assembly pilin Flp